VVDGIASGRVPADADGARGRPIFVGDAGNGLVAGFPGDEAGGTVEDFVGEVLSEPELPVVEVLAGGMGFDRIIEDWVEVLPEQGELAVASSPKLLRGRRWLAGAWQRSEQVEASGLRVATVRERPG